MEARRMDHLLRYPRCIGTIQAIISCYQENFFNAHAAMKQIGETLEEFFPEERKRNSIGKED